MTPAQRGCQGDRAANSRSGMSTLNSWIAFLTRDASCLGGPYADASRVLIIVNARDRDEASTLFRDDPWTSRGILVDSEVIEWSIFLDSRQKTG